MEWRTWIASAILFTNSTLGQTIGQVTVLDLEGGQATLTLCAYDVETLYP